ncbi:MAG: hypothetical protein HY254_17940 [Burkholderiales bacterium]|nr:hypothetical protein [Burkholderiales bacterium]
MANTTTSVVDATSQPQNSGSTGNSAPDRFDASERDIAEGDDQQQPEKITVKKQKKTGDGNNLENNGLDDAGSQSTVPLGDEDDEDNNQ